MKFYYRKIEVENREDKNYYNNHIGYYLLGTSQGLATYGFITIEPRSGIELDDWEKEEIEDKRKKRNNYPLKEIKKEETEKSVPLETYVRLKELRKSLMDSGIVKER